MTRKKSKATRPKGNEVDRLLAKAGLEGLSAERTGESDRACVLVAAASLERILETLLKHRLVAGASQKLFDAYAPLSTFAGKIDVAHAFGLIATGERDDLHRIRQIRNEFAHEANPRSFESPRIRERVSALQTRFEVITGKKAETLRLEFEVSTLVLTGFLLGNLKKIRRIRTPRDPVASRSTHAVHLRLQKKTRALNSLRSQTAGESVSRR